MQDPPRRALIGRLRRAEGQIRGVIRMIESGEGCEDVARQLAAVRKALDRGFYEMVACHLQQVHQRGDTAAIADVVRILAKYG